MSALYEEKLPAHNYEYARKSLGETIDTREKCLKEIQKWLDENPHINANRDTVSLLHFLRGSKFRMDKTKSRIQNFYRLRAERIEWFTDRNPFNSEIIELLDLGLFLPLEKKDVNNYHVFIIRTGVHDTKKHGQNDVLKVCISSTESVHPPALAIPTPYGDHGTKSNLFSIRSRFDCAVLCALLSYVSA